MLTDDKNLIRIYQDYIDDEGYVQRYDYDNGRYYNTGTYLKGPKGNPGNPGRPGKDGLTPRINQDNGHWMIGDIDTGVKATIEGSIKTINGESLEGTGNIITKSYHVFSNSWNTSSIKNLCESIIADSSVEAGMSYYGKFTGSGLPSPLGQAEMTIEVIADDISNGKSLVLTIFSADTSPYKWEAQYVKINGNYPSTITWRAFQQQITNSNKLDYSLLQNTPTNISEFNNDAGYLTTHQDISGKADASDVDAIEAKIPTQATAQNQLADKDFVNSSIATATATFKGTVNSINALDNLAADNNDYAFVVTTDSAGNTIYKRYKYNGTVWVFEYDLNNSSFTAAQWASIQSGITTELVNKLSALPNANSLSASVGETINTTWANLKSARDNSQLIPGQWYRITDYVTTTIQANTQSAGHQFDIIVRADDVNVLNENAYAAKHSGDTYFANSKLEAWQLKYTLDNKYWSLVPHGEQITNYSNVYEYEGTEEINSTTYYKWYDIDYTSAKRYTLGKSVGDTIYSSQLYESGTIGSYMPASDANGKGTIYWMKDEFDNECSYDFKNIQFKFISAIENSGIVANVFYYTFSFASGDNDATITDHSLVKYCIRNKVIYIENDKVKLPFNVFRCNSASARFTKNIIIGNNISNTFSSAEYNEIIGVGCNNNSFGSGCSNNKIYGVECSKNKFYERCASNSMIGESKSNILGRGSYRNKFDGGRLITLGERCACNTFESDCDHISLGEYCRYNTFGMSCSNITFGTSESTKSYCRYIIVENGNQYIYLDCSATTSSSAYFQNVKIAQGVNNTNTYKTITHTTAGDTFQTIYKPANSVEVSV